MIPFMDPDHEQIEQVVKTGADRIELYTEEYAENYYSDACGATLDKYAKAISFAQSLGLGINAGHDLNLENLARFLTIDGIKEVSIGHALIADALYFGLENTISMYKRLLV